MKRQIGSRKGGNVGIIIGRFQMIVPDLCSEPCELCGVDEDGRPVINIMPDGCVAPEAAVGGYHLCLKCSVDYLRIDAQYGHLAWLEEPYKQGYMLFRVCNMRRGSAKHYNTNCVYTIPYATGIFSFLPMQCDDCGRDITINQHKDNINNDSCRLVRGCNALKEPPVIADITDIDQKTIEMIKAMKRQGDEVLGLGGNPRDEQMLLYAWNATAMLRAELEDIHKGHRYVLEKNGTAVVKMGRTPLE